MIEIIELLVKHAPSQFDVPFSQELWAIKSRIEQVGTPRKRTTAQETIHKSISLKNHATRLAEDKVLQKQTEELLAIFSMMFQSLDTNSESRGCIERM